MCCRRWERGKYNGPSSEMVINGKQITKIKFQVEWSMRNKDVVGPPALLSVEQGQKQEVSGRDPKIAG